MSCQFLKFRCPSCSQSKTEVKFGDGIDFLGSLLDLCDVLYRVRSVPKIHCVQLFPEQDRGRVWGWMWFCGLMRCGKSIPTNLCPQLFPEQEVVIEDEDDFWVPFWTYDYVLYTGQILKFCYLNSSQRKTEVVFGYGSCFLGTLLHTWNVICGFRAVNIIDPSFSQNKPEAIFVNGSDSLGTLLNLGNDLYRRILVIKTPSSLLFPEQDRGRLWR